jgi:GT2 family glycosyltransferase
MPTLSIIIPTYNRLKSLQMVLAALTRQTYPHAEMEIIVVSDGSTDGTDDYLRQTGLTLGINPIFQPNGGVATARNHGLQVAGGEWVLFIDDDVVGAPNLVAEHMATQRQNNNDVVVLGPLLIPHDVKLSPWVQWEQLMLNKQYDDMIAGHWVPTARQFYTGNVSLRREHLQQAGGFDPTFRRAEDVELGYRLAAMGLHFIFNPQAEAYHYAERSFQSWLQTPYAYGRNDVIFTRQRGQTWLLPQILREYHHRKLPIRATAHLCLDRPGLSNAAVNTLRSIADWACFLHLNAIARMAYSGIFNLRHYQGIADELGGRKAFFSAADKSHASSSVNEQPTMRVNS